MLIACLYQFVVAVDKLNIFSACYSQSPVSRYADTPVGLPHIYNAVSEIGNAEQGTLVRSVVDDDNFCLVLLERESRDALKAFLQKRFGQIVGRHDETDQRCLLVC